MVFKLSINSIMLTALLLSEVFSAATFLHAMDEDTIFDAVRCGNVKAVEQILKLNPKLINKPNNDGQTPLNYAAAWCTEGVARLLLAQSDILINQPDKKGKTLLCRAVLLGKKEVVSLFLEHGVDVNQPDNDGLTPLCWAAICGNKGLVRLLLTYGASLAGCNDEKPLDCRHVQTIYAKIKRKRLHDAQFTLCSGLHSRAGTQSRLRLILSPNMVKQIAECLNPEDFNQEVMLEMLKKRLPAVRLAIFMGLHKRTGVASSVRFATLDCVKKICRYLASEHFSFKIRELTIARPRNGTIK